MFFFDEENMAKSTLMILDKLSLMIGNLGRPKWFICSLVGAGMMLHLRSGKGGTGELLRFTMKTFLSDPTPEPTMLRGEEKYQLNMNSISN